MASSRSCNSLAIKTFCLRETDPTRLIFITGNIAKEYSRICGSSASLGSLNFTSSTACLISLRAVSMSYPTSNSATILAKLRRAEEDNSLIPGTLLSLFSSGLAINLEASPGEAPSRNTETLTKGSCTLGSDATGMTDLA